MAVFRASGYAALAAVALTGFLATSAQAENKLFPTDVLDKGQVDISATLGAHQEKSNFFVVPFDAGGSTKSHGESLDLSARYGLGAHWHIGANLEYASARSKSSYDWTSETDEDKASGWQGGSVWAKYGFLDGKTSPLSLSAEVGADFFTDKNLSHESFNSAHAQVTAGWDFGRGTKGYSLISVSVPSRAAYNQFERFAVGGWFEINDRFTLNPQLGFTHHQASSVSRSFSSTQLEVSGLIRLSGNTYLSPALALWKGSSTESKDGFVQQDGGRATTASINLYHLY
jgi:hypothetical protein